MNLRKVLSLPGVHFLATRFGGSALKRKSFDANYANGTWVFVADRSSELVSLVEQYAQNGHILMLGCGTASIAGVLDPAKYASFLGLDLSEEAIALAKKYENNKISCQVGDMLSHQCARDYDLIIFPESIYYLNVFQRRQLLRRLAGHLTKQGKILVTLAQPKRYAGILKMIRNNFQVDEDRAFRGSTRHLIVFH
jgi:trans-aconitate methyltransferase